MILTLTCFYNRAKVSELFLQHQRKLNLSTLVAVSTIPDMELCEKYKTPFIYTPNEPLGTKWNELGKAALEYEWTHVMIMGDDNLLHPDALPLYENHLDKDFFGLNSIYFIHPESQQAKQLTYTLPDRVIGAGRVISRKAFQAAGNKISSLVTQNILNYTKGNRIETTQPVYNFLASSRTNTEPIPIFRLWNHTGAKGMDFSCDLNLALHGYLPYQIRSPRPLIIDIKTSQNIWPFETFETAAPADYSRIVESWSITSALERVISRSGQQ